MEHNFNPNKGDYKYILEEERRKENGVAVSEPAKLKKDKNIFHRLLNFIQVLFFQQSNKRGKVNVSLSFILQSYN